MLVKKINKYEWSSFVEECPTSTFFHTPEWYEVWYKYQNRSYEARLFQFPSGRKALLPLSKKKGFSWLIYQYMSSVAYTYGGILSNDQLSSEEIKSIKKYLLSFSLLHLRSNPLNNFIDDSFYTLQDFTQILNLKVGWDNIWKAWTKGHSSAAKKGIREGIIVKEGVFDDWLSYYKIYLKTYERWENKPNTVYSWDLFKHISELDEEKRILWLATLNNKVVAGAICFYYNKHVVYWHGAALSEFYSFKPVHVLQHDIIRDAIDRKFDWYDFNPSGGHIGVENFKKGFGTIKLPSNVYISKSCTKRIFRYKQKIVTSLLNSKLN